MKLLLLIILSLLSFPAVAEGLSVDEVNVECTGSELCEERRTKYMALVSEYRSLVHLKDTLRLLTSDGGYQTFSYELVEKDQKKILNIRFRMKPLIESINVGFTDRNLQSDPSLLVNLKEGDFYEVQKLTQNLEGLDKRLEGLGFPNGRHKFEVTERNGKVSISVAITLGRPLLFKGVSSNSSSVFVNRFLKDKFIKLYNKPFEVNTFKISLEDAQKDLFNYGYYLIALDFVPTVKAHRVSLEIRVNNDHLFAFDFKNLHAEDELDMLNLMKDLFRRYKRPLSDVTIKQAIHELFEKKAYLNTEVKVETTKFTNKFREEVTLNRLTFDEKYKTRFENLNFTGNVFFPTKKLKEMFDKEAFELASIHLYDKEYFDYFADYLKQKYYENGFVQARVVGPVKNFDADKQFVSVDYNILEGQRAFVREIQFEGLPVELEDRAMKEMNNRPDQPFNPLTLSDDIKKITTLLQESGYYFAEVKNGNDDSLVAYSKSGGEVDIRPVVNLGPLVKLNRVLFLGNYKTRRVVLEKKVRIERGELITPSRTRDLEAALSSTGLFNTVNVVPVKHASKTELTDVIVRVTERDYGLMELAPGYRTDIGLKLTGTATYSNIGGMNRSLTLTGQVNQRLNYQVFDPRKKRNPFIEYNTTLTYNEGGIFNSQVDYSATLTNQRKRYYSWDGDVNRFSNNFTRDWTKKFSTSMRYQYETITQWNAVQARDNGSFQIGAVTPNLTYDLRNSQTIPTKGAYFNLSCEFANPYFLSQKTSEEIVDYYKLVTRNRFYLPFKNGTIALSLVAGVQQNLATGTWRDARGNTQTLSEPNSDKTQTRTEGYIPSIKIFRLSGMDIVRGFTDQEINKLPDKRDMYDVRVQNQAFLALAKLEPRYFINDSFMTGVFLDAGRVYVDQMDLSVLRTSTGITFKIVTPVGTLDFDYGIKLQRQKDINGNLESPGRFHVSIGFF